jgi:hypothetical protein
VEAATPADPIEDRAWSLCYWQGKEHPRPNVLVLDEMASMKVRGGLDVFTRGQTFHFDAGPGHKKPIVIVLGFRGGMLTVPALQFCADNGINVILGGWLGELDAFVCGKGRQDAALVRAQCRADKVAIARELVAQKLRHYQACGRLSAADVKEAKGKLRCAYNIVDIMRVEALWGALSWGPLAGLRLGRGPVEACP